jgi:hypothetical protein
LVLNIQKVGFRDGWIGVRGLRKSHLRRFNFKVYKVRAGKVDIKHRAFM